MTHHSFLITFSLRTVLDQSEAENNDLLFATFYIRELDDNFGVRRPGAALQGVESPRNYLLFFPVYCFLMVILPQASRSRDHAGALDEREQQRRHLKQLRY